MSIVEYLGPYGVNDQLIDKTRVVCKCPLCNRKRKTRYGAYKILDPLGVCCLCSNYGEPLRAEYVLKEYDSIVSVGANLGARGDVVSSTKVITVCPSCYSEREVNFSTVRDSSSGWRLCRECSTFKQFGNDAICPKDVSEIVGYDQNTLGSLSQLVSRSIVYHKCLTCGDTVKCNWYTFQIKDGHCINCKSIVGNSNKEKRRKHSEWMKNKWKEDPGFFNHDFDYGGTSVFHRDVKKAMLQNGISGFESEQWVNANGRKRLDEYDKERDLSVLCHGNYWHMNPSKYSRDDVFINGKTAEEIWADDEKYIEDLKSNGISTKVIWEHDWNQDQNKIINKIKQWIKENS